MNLNEALSIIESHEFAANLNVVGGTRPFFAAASREPAVIALRESIASSGFAMEEVLGHVSDLGTLEIDRRYENPNDTALAVLLWSLYFADANPGWACTAAEMVDRAPQCWYAKKLARRILLPPPVASGDSWSGEARSAPSNIASLSGDMVFGVITIDSSMPWFDTTLEENNRTLAV